MFPLVGSTVYVVVVLTTFVPSLVYVIVGFVPTFITLGSIGTSVSDTTGLLKAPVVSLTVYKVVVV